MRPYFVSFVTGLLLVYKQGQILSSRIPNRADFSRCNASPRCNTVNIYHSKHRRSSSRVRRQRTITSISDKLPRS
jgi:hypothetical protein